MPIRRVFARIAKSDAIASTMVPVAKLTVRKQKTNPVARSSTALLNMASSQDAFSDAGACKVA